MCDQKIPIAGNINRNVADHSDLEIWHRIRRGDTSAFSLLFKKYYEQLYQFSGKFIKDAQAAENIVQDLFVVLWTQREKLDIKSNLKSYLYISVKNRSLNYKKQRTLLISESPHPTNQQVLFINPEDQYIEKELHAAVNQAIDKLPEKCRQIYLMKRYDHLSYTEIAEVLSISINTVKTQMKRAFKSLQQQLMDFC